MKLCKASLAIFQFEVETPVSITELVSRHSELFDYGASPFISDGFARTKSDQGTFLITTANNTLADCFEKPWRECKAVEVVLFCQHLLSIGALWQLGTSCCEITTSDSIFFTCHLGHRDSPINVRFDPRLGKVGFQTRLDRPSTNLRPLQIQKV